MGDKRVLLSSVSFTGYPLPTLLRLSLLALHTAPYEPLDVFLSYSHLNLQNSTFLAFASAFRDRARVGQLVTASPLNMGLLTPSVPSFHPASPGLRQATIDAQATLLAKDAQSGGLVDVSLGYAYREAHAADLPTVVGFSRPSEVHETIKVWRDLQAEEGTAADATRRAREADVLKILAPFVDYSWPSP